MIANRVLSIKEVSLVVHMILVKLKVMHAEVGWNKHNNPTKQQLFIKTTPTQHQPLLYK